MSLLDDLRNLLARHLAHTQSQTQQGAVRWIEDHLERLDAVVSSDIAAGEAKVHEILGELYAATNAPTPAPAPEPTAPAATDPTAVVAEPPVSAMTAPADSPTSMAANPAPVEPAPAPAAAEETADAPTETPSA